jgi:type I restriction enzyme R subunit
MKRLAPNDSDVWVLFDEQLRTMARELAEDGAGASVRVSASIGTRRYGYPPDKQEQATQMWSVQAPAGKSEWAA